MSSRTGEATPNPVLDISRFCDLHEEGYLELHFALVLEIIRAAAQPMPCGSYLVIGIFGNLEKMSPKYMVIQGNKLKIVYKSEKNAQNPLKCSISVIHLLVLLPKELALLAKELQGLAL